MYATTENVKNLECSLHVGSFFIRRGITMEVLDITPECLCTALFYSPSGIRCLNIFKLGDTGRKKIKCLNCGTHKTSKWTPCLNCGSVKIGEVTDKEDYVVIEEKRVTDKNNSS